MAGRWAAIMVVALVCVACGAAGGNAQGGFQESTSATSSSASTAATATTGRAADDPTDDGVVRVLFAGDSLMEEIHASVDPALGNGAETQFFLSPRLIRDEAQRVLWQQTLDSFRPDVVVAIFSHWERLIIGAQSADDVEDVDAYAGLVALPFAEFVEDSGASLVWLSAPPLRNERISGVYEVLNTAYRSAVDASTTATFVELAPALTDQSGSYQDVLVNNAGAEERIRNTDGIHLCPGGAVLVAEAILPTLTDLTGAEPKPGWQNGDWRTSAPFDEPAECPAVS